MLADNYVFSAPKAEEHWQEIGDSLSLKVTGRCSVWGNQLNITNNFLPDNLTVKCFTSFGEFLQKVVRVICSYQEDNDCNRY